MKKKIDINNPIILQELWEGSTFDKKVYNLLEQYSKAQENNELKTHSPKIKKLTQDIYHHLTTTRNRNLITHQQQKKLRKTVGGFFGMSTGSHAVTTWIMESRADAVKIIDPDHISPTNLNRMRFGWHQVGQNKIDAVEAEINNVSPFTQVIKTVQTDQKTTANLFTNSPKLDFVVEAIDDLADKVKLRLLAKKHQLPLIMATDVGDNAFIDIERYDTNPDQQLFNGRVKNIEAIDFEHLSPQHRIQLAMQIVGFEHNSEAMLSSLESIGQKIGSWPQLGATATLAGAVTTTLLKKIILNENISSGRYYLSLDDLFVSDFNSQTNLAKRNDLIKKIYKRFGNPNE